MKTYDRGDVGQLLFIIFFVIMILIMFGLISCGRKAVPVASSDTTYIIRVKEVIKDTTVYIEDYGGWSAWAECDSLGRITLRDLIYEKGKYIEPKVVVKNNYIKSECKIDLGAVYLAYKERFTETQTKINTVTVKEVNKLTWWQVFWIWTGRVLMAVIAGLVLVAYLRRYGYR